MGCTSSSPAVEEIGSGDKGDVYQLETLDDKLFHELQIHPSKGGLNIRGRMEDLVHVHREQHLDTPLCYASKKVDQGLNHYVLLSTKPLFEGQSKSPIISPYGDTFMFAALEFDVKQKVGKVFAIFHTKEEKEAGNGRQPLFTIHQCNRNVWVVKRHGQICAAFNQWKGMAKLTCWRLIICKGEDPVLMMLLAECIDSFLPVAKSQFWKFTDNNSETNIDFPPLPDGMETKLFGK
ncbi:hypothetical protein IV203_012164 [Nitzschia inconspicua]|uniref:Uncharacterized protein n=1 Tax=Nitzschia inconspicua TaxID=303405 RepID=A0A9K3KU16_9STRA|nr:hypothetical protein IV203_012164 [Nitzschia inconspicua]